MPQSANATALPPALPSELLSYILSRNNTDYTVLICEPREAFLNSLILSTSPPAGYADPESESVPSPRQKHPLLIPTLQQIASSRNIKLVFLRTVSHLRAWLGAFPPSAASAFVDERLVSERRVKRVRLLLVYGLLEMHRDGSDWSAQGLGNTISSLVDAGWRAGRRVVIVEDMGVDSDPIEMVEGAVDDDQERADAVGDRLYNAMKVWTERVPMLNGSVRRAGLDIKDGPWSGRTVEVGRILSRWFVFGRASWASQDSTTG